MALEALGDGEVGVKTSGRHGGGTNSWRSFTLDKALGPSTSQEEVFRQVGHRVIVSVSKEGGEGETKYKGGGGGGRGARIAFSSRWPALRGLRQMERCYCSLC